MNENTGTGVSSDKEQVNESPSIWLVSCLGLGSDSPFGSDRDPGVTLVLTPDRIGSFDRFLFQVESFTCHDFYCIKPRDKVLN